MPSKGVDIEILPNGLLRFCRCNEENGEIILEVLKDELTEEKRKSLEEFFESYSEMESVLGELGLCG